MNDIPRITLRPTKEDEAILDAIAGHLRRARRSPFVSKTDAVRFALKEAERALAARQETEGRLLA